MQNDGTSVLEKISKPELVFGLVAPIGTNLTSVTKALRNSLQMVGYQSSHIKLTDEMTQFKIGIDLDDNEPYKYYDSRIRFANAVRERTRRNDALALLAIAAVRKSRASLSGTEDATCEGHAYIISQLKHPDEIERLRSVYGKQFITVCIYDSHAGRKQNLESRIEAHPSFNFDSDSSEEIAIKLIRRDYNELKVRNGQRIRDAFPKGDVFIDASSESSSLSTVSRFINLLFGRNDISPTIEEYGLYLAKTASLRSLDLSRQIGAAILTPEGEVLALGCNEVPKFGGGNYWPPDDAGRDFFKGHDPNEREKSRILLDIVDKFKSKRILSDRLSNLPSDQILENLLDAESDIYIGDARVLDILEFGRIIHAEMSAICDCARLNGGVRGATLYSTTFPCHICAKHIVAAGITNVVFLEPYPKSHAASLHDDSISIDDPRKDKVLFKPFVGVAPFRYQELFEKGKRKGPNGKRREWIEEEPRPRISISTVRTYVEAEKISVSALLALMGAPTP
jgi:cytidine deaminase